MKASAALFAVVTICFSSNAFTDGFMFAGHRVNAGGVWFCASNEVNADNSSGRYSQVVPISGNITSFVFRPFESSSTANIIATLTINGVDSPATVTILPGDLSLVELTTMVPVVVGDLISLKVDTTASGGAAFGFLSSWAVESVPQAPSTSASSGLWLGALVLLIGFSIFFVRKPISKEGI